jgi:hypothetical protein
MKLINLIFVFTIFFNINQSVAQKIGQKKEVMLQLKSYGCFPINCYIELKDIKNDKIYGFENIDMNTNSYGLEEKMQAWLCEKYNCTGDYEGYYLNKMFIATLEYKLVNESIREKHNEPEIETGKKIPRWIILNLKQSLTPDK